MNTVRCRKWIGDIIEDLMKVWAGLDTTQKAGLSQSLAGKYQVARFQALMNRSDLYNQYKGASENASGTLDVMNEKYVNSLEGRMNKLQASAENLFDDLFDTEDFYAPVDALTQIVDLTDQFVNALGGVKGMLSGIAPIATQVFAKNIGNGISSMLYNRDLSKIQANNKNQAFCFSTFFSSLLSTFFSPLLSCLFSLHFDICLIVVFV